MHELAVCQALIDQVENIAREQISNEEPQSNETIKVLTVKVQIGPLSGVEAPLLQHAYPLAIAGTIAEDSVLEIEELPIKVRCQTCGAETEATANRLICGECGDYRTELISGDEMLLASIEFDKNI